MDWARKTAATNLEAIARLGAKTVVFACPGCLRTFKEDMPRLLGEPLRFEALHLSEFITREFVRRPVRLQKVSRIVTYHDPCNLGRHLGIYEPPRQLIESLPGVRLVEMPRNREKSFCCGNGGFVRYDYEEMSVENELDRFAEAEATGAEAVVSACPACKMALLDAKRRASSKVEVLDILELLAEAL
jgi:heterodisulfide reductase subunit D